MFAYLVMGRVVNININIYDFMNILKNAELVVIILCTIVIIIGTYRYYKATKRLNKVAIEAEKTYEELKKQI